MGEPAGTGFRRRPDSMTGFSAGLATTSKAPWGRCDRMGAANCGAEAGAPATAIVRSSSGV